MSRASQAGGLRIGLAVVGGELGLRHHRLLGPPPAPPPLGRLTPAAASPSAGPSPTALAERARRPNEAAARAASVSAAAPACRHIDGRSRVVTTGSGGSP